MSAPRSLETNVLFLCGELSHIFHGALTSEFKKNRIGITVEQFSILALLFYQEGINQQEISVRLNRNKTTITRVISNMERNKMITRATDKNDSRGKLIFLTKKGRDLQQKAIAHSGALYMKAVGGLSSTALDQSARLLNMIMQNVKK
ncbi:MAG: MarR family transcriptional regulator [Bacteroidota bacterium]